MIKLEEQKIRVGNFGDWEYIPLNKPLWLFSFSMLVEMMYRLPSENTVRPAMKDKHWFFCFLFFTHVIVPCFLVSFWSFLGLLFFSSYGGRLHVLYLSHVPGKACFRFWLRPEATLILIKPISNYTTTFCTIHPSVFFLLCFFLFLTLSVNILQTELVFKYMLGNSLKTFLPPSFLSLHLFLSLTSPHLSLSLNPNSLTPLFPSPTQLLARPHHFSSLIFSTDCHLQ